MTEDVFNFYKWTIDNDYHYTWFLDFLPSAFVSRNQSQSYVYESGIPIGYYDIELDINNQNQAKREYYIYNHHEITI
jgi:hypothetical protein